MLQGVCCQEVCWMQESYYRYVGLKCSSRAVGAERQDSDPPKTGSPRMGNIQGVVTGLVTQAQPQHFTCDLTLSHVIVLDGG